MADRYLTGANSIRPGDLVISHPHWGEGERVCFVTEHTRRSTVALQINRLADIRLRELFEDKGYVTDSDAAVYHGGDYNPGALILLHDSNWSSSNTMHINKLWSISSDYHMLDKIAQGNTPRDIKFILGVTAWKAQELETDLESDTPQWLHLEAPDPYIIMAEPEEQYELALSRVSSRLWNQYL